MLVELPSGRPGLNATVGLGVKTRMELRECVEAEARGRLAPKVLASIDGMVARG